MKKYDKLKISLEYQLLGKGYYQALKAFNLAQKYHKGLRKDGETKEFRHQLDICHYILTLPLPQDKLESYLIAALLHDIREDYGIEHEYILNTFGNEIAEAVESLTKKFKGVNKSYDSYFSVLATNQIGSIVKGADRINNINTMTGVFSIEKQLSYVEEVNKWFLPMLKEARKNFPIQTHASFNVEFILRQQVKFIESICKDQKED